MDSHPDAGTDLTSEDPLAPPPAAAAIFGTHLPRALEYARLLATDGVVRGLIGPREVPRLWDRHLLNCAVTAELVGDRESVVDVGSGAGLPGVVLALLRPDARVALVESLARRVTFLEECRTALDLANVTVVHGRAEDRETVRVAGRCDVVVSRAVAPLDRLALWCLPLLRPGGRMVAVKGASAEAELKRHESVIARRGGERMTVQKCGVELLDEPTTVVLIHRRL